MVELLSKKKLHLQIDDIYNRVLGDENMSLALRCLELKFKLLQAKEEVNSEISFDTFDDAALEKLIQELEM